MFEARAPFPGAGIFPEIDEAGDAEPGKTSISTDEKRRALGRRLRRVRIKAAFGPGRAATRDPVSATHHPGLNPGRRAAHGMTGEMISDPVLAAFQQKGGVGRSYLLAGSNKKLDPGSAQQHQRCCASGMTRSRLTRGPFPPEGQRNARRQAPTGQVRRAPFYARDLSAPLAAIAPNLAGAAVILLILMILLWGAP